MSIRKRTNKNIVLVYLSIFCLFSSLQIDSNVRANDVCEPDYPDQYQLECIKLEWDVAPPAEVPAENSNVTVSVLAGNPPYTWTVSGRGFYLDQAGTKKSVKTNNRSVTIHANGACGFSEISVTSSCGSALTGGIRSEKGKWVRVYRSAAGVNGDSSGTPAFPGGCPSVVRRTSQLGSSATYKTVSAISENHKIVQTFNRRGLRISAGRRPYSGPAAPPYLSAEDTCNASASSPYSYVDSYKLSGSCFEFEHNCEGCDNDCHNTLDEYDFSYDLGFHSLITTNCGSNWGWCWVIGGWSYVSKTEIWKWQCN